MHIEDPSSMICPEIIGNNVVKEHYWEILGRYTGSTIFSETIRSNKIRFHKKIRRNF